MGRDKNTELREKQDRIYYYLPRRCEMGTKRRQKKSRKGSDKKERRCCSCGERIRTSAITVVRGKVWMCPTCAGRELAELAKAFEKTTAYEVEKFFSAKAS